MTRAWLKQRKMTAAQYRIAIQRLGLSQQAAGRFLLVSKNTAQRMAGGQTEVPASTAMLLRMMIEEGVKPE